MADTRVSELSDFTGGMNTLVASHLISERESTLLINVDIRLGSLASMPNLEFKERLSNGGHFFEFNKRLYSYPSYRDNVIWDNKWYWSDGINTQKMMPDGTVMELGLPTPKSPVDINVIPYPPGYSYKESISVDDMNDWDAEEIAELSDGDGYRMTSDGTIVIGVDDVIVERNDTVMWDGISFTNLEDIAGPHTGYFKYTYTFYSTLTGVESAPSPLQNEYLIAEGHTIELTNMEELPDDANQYRIYRVGGYLPNFTLVETVGVDHYTDERGDTNIDGRLLQTMYCGLPPDGLENLVEHGGRFYGSVGNKVYYSALGNPDAWYISDYFVAKDIITGMVASPGGLLVMGRFFTMMFYGTQPQEYFLKLLSDHLGCLDKRSIAFIGDSAIWMSHRSFVMCNGYDVTDITAYKIDYIKGIIPSGAVVDDNTYYMSFKPQLVPEETLFPEEDLYPNLVEGTGGLEEGIIALDFKRGNGFSYKMIKYDRIVSLGIVRGDVHVGTGGPRDGEISCERVLFPDCDQFLNCSGFAANRLARYNNQGLTTLTYLSPRLADGSLSTLKEYDKVRVLFVGDFTIKVILGGNVVIEKEISAPIITDIDNLDKLSHFELIGIPNKRNKGHYIRFLITGVGVVHAIQYSWKPRELVN